MKKLLFIIAVLLLVSSVSAETLTGNFDSAEGWSSKLYSSVGTHPTSTGGLKLNINNTELTQNSKSLIAYDYSGGVSTFDAGAPESAWTTMNVSYGSHVIATGTIGYQRLWDSAFPIPAEIGGYQYLIFDNWNITGLSGNINTNVSYDSSDLYNWTPPASYGGTSYPTGATGGYMRMGKIYTSDGLFYPFRGNWVYNYDLPFHNSYSATRPGGLGISGYVDKSPSSTPYNSKAVIYNGTSGVVITSQGLVTGDNFNFTVLEMPIIIGVIDSNGVPYNSSVLFGYSIPPVPTWTPDPNATPPAGYVRTWFINQNGADGSAIPNSAIDLYDVEAGIWKNTSPLVNNLAYIDTLPNHTINAYGHATGFTSDTRNGLPALPDGVYHLTLWGYLPTPPAGNITLIVIVTGQSAGSIEGALVRVTQADGKSFATNTGNAGTAYFTVTNSSSVSVTASKQGYQSSTVYSATSAAGPDTVRITLLRATVTTQPTLTPGPGGTVPTTVKPGQNPDGTYQPGYSTLEGQNMLNWLAANGMSLVQLCFFVTILALLGVKLGK